MKSTRNFLTLPTRDVDTRAHRTAPSLFWYSMSVTPGWKTALYNVNKLGITWKDSVSCEGALYSAKEHRILWRTSLPAFNSYWAAPIKPYDRCHTTTQLNPSQSLAYREWLSYSHDPCESSLSILTLPTLLRNTPHRISSTRRKPLAHFEQVKAK